MFGLARKQLTRVEIPVKGNKNMYSTESWRGLANELGGNIPVPFILKWIDVESGGSPCATGGATAKDGTVREAGIFQFFYPDDYQRLGLDVNTIRACCEGIEKGHSQNCVRQMTDDEKNYQMAAGIKYIHVAMFKASNDLAVYGSNWNGSPDYWKMVKMQHNAPGLALDWLKAFRKVEGFGARSFQEYRDYVMTHPGLWGKYGKAKVLQILNNADKVGGAVLG